MQKLYFCTFLTDIPLLSILKLFVNLPCHFSGKVGNYYLPLNLEYSSFTFINDNSKKIKMGKKESVKVVQYYSILMIANFAG